jgi:hypothetical protein
MNRDPRQSESNQKAPEGSEDNSLSPGIPEAMILRAITQNALRPQECKQCGGDFSITSAEVRFFLSRSLHLPKRCKKCRRKPHTQTETPNSMKNKFFSDRDATRIPMVPWRHV